MDRQQKERLSRYFMNNYKFFWGLIRGNQTQNYRWLRGKGLTVETGSYTHVASNLLAEPGIEKLITDVVIPRVNELFAPAAMDYFRTCWEAGTRPDISVLKMYNLDSPQNADPFVEINSQFNYVVRWGDLAGIWFEEVEKTWGK